MQTSTLRRFSQKPFWTIVLVLTLAGTVAPALSPLMPQANAQSRSVWQSLKASDGRFTILMPGKSDRTIQSLQVLGQSAKRTVLSAEQWQHGASYSVSWTDLPKSLDISNQRQKAFIFEEMLSHLSHKMGGQLTQESDLKLSGHPGKQYQLQSWNDGETYLITSRAFMIGPRFFQISVTMPERKAPGLRGSTKGFLKSFQLR